MSRTELIFAATITACLSSAALAGPPALVNIGMGLGDISADGMTASGAIYDARLDAYIVYQFKRGLGGFRTEALYSDGEIRSSADGNALSWGYYDTEDLTGFGTDRNVSHRWTGGTGSVNLGIAPNGYNCDFNVNTPYDISGDGRYVVGGGWTDSLCGPFRAFRYDSLTTLWEQLPVSISAPPLNLPANATRANACSLDGSVVAGYDQNYNLALTNRSRHPAVWVKTGSTWAQTVLDWSGGEVYCVSADGNTIAGEDSTGANVRWTRSGSTWTPHTIGGDGSWFPVAISADGSTIVGAGGTSGGGFIWRETINGGVAMDLPAYVASLGGSFPNFTFGAFGGSPVRGISADGNAILISGFDDHNPCLTTGLSTVLYLNGTTCEAPGINFSPVSQIDPDGPVPPNHFYGFIMNCFATGSWPLQYQWQKETGPGTGVWTNLTDDNCDFYLAGEYDYKGTTNSQLRIGGLSPDWAGRYRCVVTNSCGTVTSGVARAALCVSDFDGDGFVTGDDFDAYVAIFELGGDDADVDGNGFVTGDDFDAYVLAFEAGC